MSITRATCSALSPRLRAAPPVRRGDVYRDFDDGCRVFLIADGVFYQDLAVTAGELMDLLRAGALIFGSSSMGAMRAAELHQHGMYGVGRIYELVESTPVFMDDWLGHLFDPDSFALLTLPFVELLFLLEPHVETPLEQLGRAMHTRYAIRFDSLTRSRCEEIVDDLAIPAGGTVKAQVAQLFAGRRRSQKQRDAITMVRACLRHLARVRASNEQLNRPRRYPRLRR